ncbi:hypothetical protein RhiirC2_791917 [Rhizophagus irregularis]|uniref:CCHC-type domain-containing protein n=1 Tax=Rhizophagus irregularis TaxID=588596 RepID=A0A2N1MI88_9GLOM|nr:hypothetical protein RhiirC2_791917 [Rhizophagus irregularis]
MCDFNNEYEINIEYNYFNNQNESSEESSVQQTPLLQFENWNHANLVLLAYGQQIGFVWRIQDKYLDKNRGVYKESIKSGCTCFINMCCCQRNNQQNNNNRNNNGRDLRNVDCYNCERKGHVSRNCRSSPSNNNNGNNGTNNGFQSNGRLNY